jgi:hypothetical protein
VFVLLWRKLHQYLYFRASQPQFFTSFSNIFIHLVFRPTEQLRLFLYFCTSQPASGPQRQAH